MSRKLAALGHPRARSLQAAPSPGPDAPASTLIAEARGLVLPATGCDRPLSFELRSGECLGILALAGNGLAELEAVAAGLAPPSAGEFLIGGRPSGSWPRGELRRSMMGYLPSDRDAHGIALEASITDNLLVLDRVRLGTRAWLLPSLRAGRARDIATRFGPEATVDRPALTLSGGNRQRLLLSRELGSGRPFLLLADPSQGLDLEATETLARRLEDERSSGAGILLLSSSIEEVTRLSDRIAVLYRGSIVWEGPNLGEAMAGRLTAHLTGLTSPDQDAAAAGREGRE